MSALDMDNERKREILRKHRSKLQEAGFKQSAIWLPEDIHNRVNELVKAKQFRSRSEAITVLLGEKLEETA